MNQITLFPLDMCSNEDLHNAVIRFITNWLNLYHNSNDFSQTLENIKRHFNYIFQGSSPGFSLEADGNLTGYYDTDWMPEEGIEKFRTGESYIVSFDKQNSMLYPLAQYSREELSGWFSLAMDSYTDQFPDIKEKIIDIQNIYYLPGKVKDNLVDKISGKTDWKYKALTRVGRNSSQ